jgi:SHS2 domain-containing protein
MNHDHHLANPATRGRAPRHRRLSHNAPARGKVPLWAHWRSVLVIARAGVVHSGILDAGKGRAEGEPWLRIEAWAESRDECVAEALRGLIASFADISDMQPARVLERPITASSDADLLASAADEVIYILDVEGEIPVSVQVRPAGAGIVVVLALARAELAEITGAVPKAVSFHGLRCEPDATGRWSASMTIDV